MSWLEELEQKATKRNALEEKRVQIETLRGNAQAAYKEQFRQEVSKERLAYLQGRLDAFDECIQLFMSAEEKAAAQKKRKAEDEEE